MTRPKLDRSAAEVLQVNLTPTGQNPHSTVKPQHVPRDAVVGKHIACQGSKSSGITSQEIGNLTMEVSSSPVQTHDLHVCAAEGVLINLCERPSDEILTAKQNDQGLDSALATRGDSSVAAFKTAAHGASVANGSVAASVPTLRPGSLSQIPDPSPGTQTQMWT